MATNTRSVRSSIKERLAFFEQQQYKNEELLPIGDGLDAKLLQKSLSDEEKSKTLQRGDNLDNEHHPPAYKMNSALSSFIYDTVDNEPADEVEDQQEEEEDESESLASSQQNPKMESSDSEETADDLKSLTPAPELPKSLPPLQDAEELKEIKTDTKRYTASAQLVLGGTTTFETTTQAVADNQENIVGTKSPEKLSNELELNLNSSLKSYDKTNNNLHDNVDESHSPPAISQDMGINEKPRNMTETIQHLELENNLACNKINDNDCVTKDKATDEVSMDMDADTVAAQQLEESTTESHVNVVTKSLESMAEEQQNNDTSETDVKLRTKSLDNESREVHDVATTERLSVVRARLQQFEVITSNEKEKEKEKETEKDKHKEQATATNEVKLEDSKDLSSTFPVNENESLGDKELEIKTQNIEVETQQETLKGGKEIETAFEEIREENQSTASEEITKENQSSASQHITNENQLPLKESLDFEVPLTKDNDDGLLENKQEVKNMTHEEEEEKEEDLETPSVKSPSKMPLEEYPEDLNPFKSDDEEEDENKENVVELRKPQTTPKVAVNLNPFDSSDDEVELEKSQSSRASMATTPKIPPPRPPPPRISRNPFGSDDDEEGGGTHSFSRRSSENKRTPVPTPRSNVSQSQNPTPEPTPRLSVKSTGSTTTNFHHQHQHQQHTGNSLSNSATTTPQSNSYVLQNSSDFYGSANSLHSNYAQSPNNLLRNSDTRSSNNSLNLSAGGTIRSRKSRRAPLPPAPVKELFPSSETVNTSSKASTPSSSTVGTPKSGRKKRPAPAPPKPARLEPAAIPQIQIDTVTTQSKNLLNYPLQSELDSKLSDEEKALLEGKTLQSPLQETDSDITLTPANQRSSMRLIPLDKELLEEHLASQCDDSKQQQNLQKSISQQEIEESSVVYRRILIPHIVDTPTHEANPLLETLNQQSPTVMGERQMAKLKDNKEANNRNRQSQISAASSGAEDNDPLFNKSVHGKWKRRKGPAPALPIPPRKVLLMLPLQEIKHELEIIEVQQQGLEKQGVVLEKMIRDRCENQNGEPLSMGGAELSSVLSGEATTSLGAGPPMVENSKEVENLILQLFELVNEKNELFRRQAELMYLRRQHRLEQEQADLEYEIRVLMAQPERNKTDSDKTREEALIERLVEVVQLRNEVVECLEMDRIREAEEDLSIKQRMESHIAQREDKPENKSKSSTLSKLSKKEKKKQKEAKKLGKSKKLDADKDADESEMSAADKQKTKKKKKLLIF